MKIFTVTTYFPNSVEPRRTVFVKNLVLAMRDYCGVNVVAPVPYAPPVRRVPRWYALSQIGYIEYSDGLEVLHPRYFVVPKMDWLSGVSYFLCVLPLLRLLKRKHDRLLIHAHCAYPDGVGVAAAARILGLPYVVTAHGSDINVYSTRWVLRPQIRWALSGATGVIAVSRDLKQKITCLTDGTIKRLEYIPCAGFDPQKFFPRSIAGAREGLGLDASARVAIFVGNLVSIKNVDILIDAWSLLSQRGFIGNSDRLLIVGEGACRAELERRAVTRGIYDKVRFTGGVSQIEVSRLVAASNLLCLPSRNEGTPNVIVEALASGLPVVASKVGGIPELVQEGINGLLVPVGDSEALADALGKALSRVWDRDYICTTANHLTWQALGKRNCEFLMSTIDGREC